MGEDENARDAAEPRLMGGETYRVLGQVMGKFILVEGPKGLYFIDPHALHERWNFDRLKAEGKRGFAAAKLLLPIEIRLTPAEAAIASEAAEFLSEHGFALALREPTVLEVGAAPSFLKPKEVETLIRNVLADVDTASEAVETRREQLLASLACRSSVLLGKTLPEEELSLLIDRFLNGGQLPTCPHGRPTGFILSMDDIAKRLGR